MKNKTFYRLLLFCFLLFPGCSNISYQDKLDTQPSSQNTFYQNNISYKNDTVDSSSINTSSITLATWDVAFDNSYKSELSSIKSNWNNFQKKDEERTLLETKDLIISYNFRWGVMSMGTPNLMMIDLDYKDKEVGNRANAIALLIKCSKEYGVTFAIRETERGMHAFVVSKHMNPNSDESKKMMRSVNGDKRYIGFCELRGYCCRISPKPFKTISFGAGSVLRPRNDMKKQFISKKPNKYIIGPYQNVKPELIKILELNDRLVKLIYNEFDKNYAMMTSGKYNGKTGVINKTTLKKYLNPKIKKVINDSNYPIEGTYPLDKGDMI